jgi:hypothetical protein
MTTSVFTRSGRRSDEHDLCCTPPFGKLVSMTNHTDLFNTALVSVTIRTRSKAAYAILRLDGISTSIVGYAYSEAAAVSRARSESSRRMRRCVFAPITNGQVEVLV